MKRLLGILGVLAFTLASLTLQAAEANAGANSSPPTGPARILLVTGIDYPGHLWRQTAPALQELLQKDPRLKVTVAEDPNTLASLNPQDWDAIVLHFMNWEKPAPGEEARARLRNFVESGKGLMLVHFACGAWQDWPEFKTLVGRVWDPKLRGHDPYGRFRVEIADPGHPTVKGMAPFDTTDELYTCLTGDAPIHPVAIARSKVDGKDYPLAFVLDYGKGRVFHTVLGHDLRAITNSAVPELFRRGCAWAAGLPATAESKGPRMQARKDPASGQIDITDAGHPVLRYNYAMEKPGALYDQVQPDNRKYARARSDYIHPLFGLDGQVLTKDWSIDHPHHRGIYWAWPEVDFRGERGDLHALQRVFATPTGHCSLQSGPVFAQIDAENLWVWEDKTPMVRERAIIRAYPSDETGRCVDLELHFTALTEEVALARRGTEHYGGLNIRLAAVGDQQITFHTDLAGTLPRMAFADLSGSFGQGTPEAGLAVLQNARNPEFPGDWIKYPELNWFQPAFPSAGTRYRLKPGETLVLRFRLWIHRNSHLAPSDFAEQWQSYQDPSFANH